MKIAVAALTMLFAGSAIACTMSSELPEIPQPTQTTTLVPGTAGA